MTASIRELFLQLSAGLAAGETVERTSELLLDAISDRLVEELEEYNTDEADLDVILEEAEGHKRNPMASIGEEISIIFNNDEHDDLFQIATSFDSYDEMVDEFYDNADEEDEEPDLGMIAGDAIVEEAMELVRQKWLWGEGFHLVNLFKYYGVDAKDETAMHALSKAFYPTAISSDNLDTHHIYRMEEQARNLVNPLASVCLHLVNRVLTGAAADRTQQQGDVAISWNAAGTPNKECTLSDVKSGNTWIIRWGRDKEHETLSVGYMTNDGQAPLIAKGIIDDGNRASRLAKQNFYTTTSEAGAVFGYFANGDYEKLFDLAVALKPLIDKQDLFDRPKVVTGEHQGYLEGLRDLIEYDGGVPGDLCKAYCRATIDLAFAPATVWIRRTAEDFAKALHEDGAIWSESAREYHDGDITVCLVPMPDGSPAFYHSNRAKWDGEVGYIAWFENFEGKAAKLCVRLLEGDQPTHKEAVEAVIAGRGEPNLVVDCKTGASEQGKASWLARELLYFDHSIDMERAISEGEVASNMPWEDVDPKQLEVGHRL